MIPDARMPAAFLGSRFGRRLFVMFCLAALLPATAVFWMTYRTAASDAGEARERSLREGGKDFAIGIYGRLQLADQALATADSGAVARGERPRFLSLYFTEVSIEAARSGIPADRHASPTRLQVSPAAVDAVVRLAHATDDRRLVGTLRPSFLWGDADDMGQDMRICMFARDVRLFCGGHPRAEHGERLRTERWELFLKPSFGAESWTAVAVAGAGHGLQHYSGVLAPAAVGVLLCALLLSSLQIRKVLLPLGELLRRITVFEGRSTVVSRRAGEDEFGVLSRTFGEMQHRIGRQMDTLRTLSEVDRLILAGAPLVDLVDLVARRMRECSGAETVCVAVSAPDAGENGVLFVHRQDRDKIEQVRCPSASENPATSRRGWHGMDELPAGAARDALLGGGAGGVFVLAPGHPSDRVQVMLGFRERPRDPESIAQAAEIADAIPVAAAFEEREQRLVFQARHDPLTSLPNRLATFEAVTAAIADARRSCGRFAVVFLDLDRFKSINDGLGHAFGDELLVGVAGRIRENVSADDFVGRFGGDEFCIVLARAGDADAAERAMLQVADAFSSPVGAGDREFVQRFSAGIAFYPEDGGDASTLIRNADVAMYQGKRAGGHSTRLFAPAMNAEAVARLRMENDLRDAIVSGAIDVHYQPRVDSRSGRIVGAEALARWSHPETGPIAPSVFIELAEDCGLIDELGALVLRTSCRQLAAWQAAGLDLPVVAVNVSSRQLRSPQFVSDLRREIEAAEIRPSNVEIEITETMLVYDDDSGGRQLQRIRDLGVTIAIDDFGTGYSSLSYLAKLPCDTLKIDRSFIVGLRSGNGATAAIIRAIIAMARELGKNVVAEGVESMTEVELLAGWGCHVIQGYAYHRALGADAIAEVLQAG